MRPGGFGTCPRVDSEVTLLPQPDSPTIANHHQRAPGADREADAVDGREPAVVGGEDGAQVALFQHREGHWQRHRRAARRAVWNASMRASIASRSVRRG